MTPADTAKLVKACRGLDLRRTEEMVRFTHTSVPLAVIDAVWSIGVRYSAVENVLDKYRLRVSIDYPAVLLCRPADRLPPRTRQHSVSEALGVLDSLSGPQAADTLFSNHQRTSTRNGILKSTAVHAFLAALHDSGVEHVQDVVRLREQYSLSVRDIPGQRSGISTAYLQMLMGDEDEIKPDRWLLRYLRQVVEHRLNAAEARDLVRLAASQLKVEFPSVTARRLDHVIWLSVAPLLSSTSSRSSGGNKGSGSV